MPIVTIICPDCQRSIEVELTSLAHNTGCPYCGNALAKLPAPALDPRKAALENVRQRIRQEPDKLPAKRRRRLLSPDPEVVTEKPQSAVPDTRPAEVSSYVPKIMDDDVHERMWFDPEVQMRISWLRWGGGILAGLLGLTIIADRMNWWTGVSQYFARVTDKVLRTSENQQSVTAANQPAIPAAPKKAPSAKPAPVTKPSSAASLLPAGDFVPKNNKEAAIKAVASFLRAPDFRDRIKFVQQQDLWGPRMRQYYSAKGDGPVLFDRVEDVDGGQKDESGFTFSVVLPNGLSRKIVVGRADGGSWLVDWASFVLYSEMDWDQFCSKRPQAPVTFRVLAVPADHFNNGFSDSKSLVCLKLANPLDSSKPALYAYANRNDAVGRALAFVMQTYSGSAMPMILRLHYPALAAAENQVLISEFVGEGWVARSW